MIEVKDDKYVEVFVFLLKTPIKVISEDVPVFKYFVFEQTILLSIQINV